MQQQPKDGDSLWTFVSESVRKRIDAELEAMGKKVMKARRLVQSDEDRADDDDAPPLTRRQRQQSIDHAFLMHVLQAMWNAMEAAVEDLRTDKPSADRDEKEQHP